MIDDFRAAVDSEVAGLTVKAADLSRAAPPRWAWDGRIVLGYLSLLLGNEGIGKSTLVAWIIARLTRGELPGHLHGEPVGVGILGDEDDFDSVWTPRLYAAGGNLDLIVQIERPDGGFVNVREDRDKLAEVAKYKRLRLLYFDQLLDGLGTGTDDWRQKPVRDALQPLRALARELDVAALGCLHPNKRANSFRELVSGSSAFNAVSRSSLLLAQHPDDENRRALVRGKGNLSAAPPALEFEIAGYRFHANGHEFKVPLAQGFQDGDLTVDALLERQTPDAAHSKVAEACEVVEALLPRDGAWHPAKPIIEACAANDIDERTAKRAKVKLGIEHHRTTTFPATVEWRWPPTQDTVRTSAETVPTVPTVPTANGRKALWSSSEDTLDTEDTQNERPHCVPTVEQPA